MASSSTASQASDLVDPGDWEVCTEAERISSRAKQSLSAHDGEMVGAHGGQFAPEAIREIGNVEGRLRRE